jgi:hypothetical protein
MDYIVKFFQTLKRRLGFQKIIANKIRIIFLSSFS